MQVRYSKGDATGEGPGDDPENAKSEEKDKKVVGSTSNIDVEEKLRDVSTPLGDRLTLTSGHRSTTGEEGSLINFSTSTKKDGKLTGATMKVGALNYTFDTENFGFNYGVQIPFRSYTFNYGLSLMNGVTTRLSQRTGPKTSTYTTTTFKLGGYTYLGGLLIFFAPEAIVPAIPALVR